MSRTWSSGRAPRVTEKDAGSRAPRGARRPQAPRGSRRPRALRGAVALLLAAALSLACLGASGCADEGAASVEAPAGVSGTSLGDSGLRERYVDVASARSATVMVYMCGSDLESGYGAASADIEEMLEADLGEDVSVVVETGGASDWSFSPDADPGLRQRWSLEDGEVRLEGDTGAGTMLDASELTDFCSWAAASHPADRYLLVLWDHGGGTIGGFGYDENYPDAPALTLSQLRDAIADSGVTLDLVGFDACLMGTVGCAYALEPVADFLVASEETEPADGWAWTGFLDRLGADPSVPTEDLGRTIVDDFTRHYVEAGEDGTTLSLVDLREVTRVYDRLGSFLSEAGDSIQADNALFSGMSGARSRAKAYGEGSVDQVDLVDLVQRSGFDDADAVAEAVSSCVRYRSDASSGSNGLAMYFPYSEVAQYAGVRQVLQEIGYTEPVSFYDYFLSVMGSSPAPTGHGVVSAAAQAAVAASEGSAASSAASSGSYADGSLAQEGWFEDLAGGFSYQELPDELELAWDDGSWVVEMDEGLWDAFSDFQVTVMQRHGDGYLMLGTDDAYQLTDDYDIAVDFDGEWLAIDGTHFSFYCDEPEVTADGETRFSGTIPALLNGGEQVELVVTWPTASEREAAGEQEAVGRVLGFRLTGQEQGHVLGRGLGQLEAGDTLTPLFDSYDADGEWVGTVEGDPVVVRDPGALEVRYVDAGDANVVFWGTLTTVYGTGVDTEVLTTEG